MTGEDNVSPSLESSRISRNYPSGNTNLHAKIVILADNLQMGLGSSSFKQYMVTCASEHFCANKLTLQQFSTRNQVSDHTLRMLEGKAAVTYQEEEAVLHNLPVLLRIHNVIPHMLPARQKYF